MKSFGPLVLAVLWQTVHLTLIEGADEGTAEEAVIADEAGNTEPANGTSEVEDLLAKLSVTMISEVIDPVTMVVREGGRKLYKLGNAAVPDWSDLPAEDQKVRWNRSLAALEKAVNKQMVWWKAAAEEFQPPPGESTVVVGDVWTIEGRHISSQLIASGHLVAVDHYQEELARDILSAEAEQQKKEQYRLLEEALRETAEEVKVKKPKSKPTGEGARADATQPDDGSLGFGGWIGLILLAITVIGAVLNFGRESKKRPNPNRKKGTLELFWNKLKRS